MIATASLVVALVAGVLRLGGAPMVTAAATAALALLLLVLPLRRRRRATRVVAVAAVIAGAVLGDVAVGFVNGEPLLGEPVASTAGYTGREPAFHAVDGRFNARFPSEPEREVRTGVVGVTEVAVTFYVSESSDLAIAVMYFDLPPEVPFDLEAALDGGAAAVDGRVEQSDLTELDGRPGIEGLITVDSRVIRSAVARADTRVYSVQVVAPEDPLEAFRTFLETFEIVGEAGS